VNLFGDTLNTNYFRLRKLQGQSAFLKPYPHLLGRPRTSNTRYPKLTLNKGAEDMVMGTLVIDRFEVRETPQSGNWLMGFTMKVRDQDDCEAVFHVPNKTYEGDGILIEARNTTRPTEDQRVELTDVEIGSIIEFWIGLDDDEADVLSDAEDQAEGSFKATRKGLKRFHPNDQWDMSITYHMELY
jgi:hypothetical protein